MRRILLGVCGLLAVAAAGAGTEAAAQEPEHPWAATAPSPIVAPAVPAFVPHDVTPAASHSNGLALPPVSPQASHLGLEHLSRAAETGMGERRPAGTVALGATLGMAAGLGLGAGLGYLVYEIRSQPPFHEPSWFGPGEAWVGAAVGAAAGAFVGAQWANRWQGQAGWTALGAVAGVGLGFGAGLLAGDATGSTAVGFAVGIPIAVALPTLAEVLGSR